MKPDVGIKRIYEPPGPGDGARVLVDRLWPRGVSKEAAALTLWLREIAPSTALRKAFGHDPAHWEAFVRDYRAELAGNAGAVATLRALAAKGRVTLLYGARDPLHNQAAVLADYLRAGAR